MKTSLQKIDSEIKTISFSNSFWEKNVYGFLLLTLFCSWFTYPLVFGVSHPKIFKGIVIILLLASLLFISLSNISARRVDFLLQPQWLIPIFLYLIYLICYTSITIIQFDESSLTYLLSLYIKIGFCWLLLYFLPWKKNIDAFELYAKFIYILSFMAIIQFVLMVKGIISPIGIITIPRGVGEATLDNYGLAFIWQRGYLNFGVHKIARLQSFADEPGSFAHGLLPALLWAFLFKKRFMLFILILALLLTLSLGGISALCFVGSLYVCKKGISYLAKVLIISLIIGAFFTSIIPLEVVKRANDYLETKINIEKNVGTTSSGQRFEDGEIALSLLGDNPWGYGANQANKVAKKNIAVGWLAALIDAGIIGGAAYFIAFTWLFLLAIYYFLKKDDKIYVYVCASYITSYIMSGQRAQIDSSFWLLWIVVSLLMIGRYANKPQIVR